MSGKTRQLIVVAVTLIIGVGIGIAIVLFLGEFRRPSSAEVLRAGFTEEFIDRNDGYPGLIRLYGLRFPYRPQKFNLDEVYRELAEKRVDVISGYSTAASMKGGDFIALKDDKNFFLPYELAPVVRRQSLAAHQELEDIFGLLAGQISDEQMCSLIYEVEERGKEPAQAARDFLVSRKLVDPGKGPGDGSAGKITIGAKNFAEQWIMSEVMAILIEHRSNLKVKRKFRLGGTGNVFENLRKGQIDLYAEYTGTALALLDLLNREDIRDPEEAYETVKRKFADDYDLVWLERFGFNNTWTIVMRNEDAGRLGIETLSDLAKRLKEQSEALARPKRGVPISPTEISEAPKERETFLTAAQRLRSLELRLQPAIESGRMGLEEEKRLQAQYNQANYESQLEAVNKDLRAGPPEASKTVRESKKKVLKARVEAEKLRVGVMAQDQALKEYLESMAVNEAEATPLQEVQVAYRRVAMTEDLLGRVEELVVACKIARNEYLRHLRFLGEAQKGRGREEDTKALRDEIEQTQEEITILEQHSDTAAQQLEQAKKQVSLAIDQLEVSEEGLKSELDLVKTVEHGPMRALPAGATVDELRREVERRKAEVERVEKEAAVFEKEADFAKKFAALKLKEKNDCEWEIGFVRSGLERLKKKGASEDEMAAVRARITSLQDTLNGVQKTLTQLKRWVKSTGLRAREKRLHAESVRRDADEAEARLRKEEKTLHSEIVSSWAMAIIFGTITIGLATMVRHLVRNKEILSLKNMADPEKEKRITTPFLLIRRVAVPVIFMVGGLVVLMQFEMFQRIGLTILASAGIVSLVVGLAARNVLANAMAGIILSFSQPIRVGDTVMMGNEFGTIEDIGLLYTTFRVWDNRRLVIPNENMAGKDVINYSLRDQRIWTKVPIHLDYAADVNRAREILIDAVKSSEAWNGLDEPEVWFMELGAETICLWVAAWADDPDKSWRLKTDILDNALRRFQEEGIPLPSRRFKLDGPKVTLELDRGLRPQEE